MSILTIRNIDPELDRSIRKKAREKGTSMNSLVLETLKETIMPGSAGPRRHHDLDHLAGTWSDSDLASFNRAVRPFEAIDPDIWK